jgi:Sulfotransferase family
MRSQPLWVIGAPRSGTTFLQAVLNCHPAVTLTNEGRLLALLKQVIEVDCARPDLVEPVHRDRFTTFLKREAGALIERYYRSDLGVTTPIWGDKHPPYADPALLSGRNGDALVQPVSGSALALIREVLPSSKFIHIRRDVDGVARSLVARRWIGSISEGERVWRQYIDEIEGFFAATGPARTLTIEYARLLEAPEESADTIARFLDLADAAPFAAFLAAERKTPTPYSAPVRDLAATVYGALR